MRRAGRWLLALPVGALLVTCVSDASVVVNVTMTVFRGASPTKPRVGA